MKIKNLKSSHRSFASRSFEFIGWMWCTLRVMFLRVKENVSFTISDLKDLDLPNHTSYLNISHIFVITFDIFFISKNLESKRNINTIVQWRENPSFSPDSRDLRNDFRFAQIFRQNLHGGGERECQRTQRRENENRWSNRVMEWWSSGAMENKAADKAIGARITSQPIVFCIRKGSWNGATSCDL